MFRIIITALVAFVFVVSVPPIARPVAAEEGRWPMVSSVERQPLLAHINRVRDAMRYLGSPLSDDVVRQLEELKIATSEEQVTQLIQEALDKNCLLAINIQDDGTPVVSAGTNRPELVEQGWRAFLVKVVNADEKRVRMRIDSPNAKPVPHSPANEVATRWLGLSAFEGQPLSPLLSGLPLEYRVLEVYSRDAGDRTARIDVRVPQPSALLANKDGRSSPIVMDWRFDQDTAGWEAMNQSRLSVRDGSLIIECTGNDPYIGVKLPELVPAGRMVLRFWGRGDEPGFGQIFWWTDKRPQPDGNHLVNFPVEAGREMMYEIPFVADGSLTGLRIDPNGRPGRFRIDWIQLAYADEGECVAGSSIEFHTVPATALTFRVIDDDDRPAMARFEITDSKGRVCPAQSKRLAPDFFFHSQIYRTTGETVMLPAGDYTIRCSRGPESIVETKHVQLGREPQTLEYRVRRWIDVSRFGYWSGDHHIHAAGCAHYENPTEGVQPLDMLRHCMGEDLKIGCCLTWGPCFDHQKQYFTGKPDENSKYPYLIRYDVEVSGFGSHMSGHLNLLRLHDQIPPGGDSKEHWPTLGLNTLRWAKRQGAVCGPAHSSAGLMRFVDRLPDTEQLDGPRGLPTFRIPAFDGIGANEFIVDVPHLVPGPDGNPVPAVDFISTMNTDRTAELNIWYHVLNCGYRVRASGETDFPCVSGDRVGMGRVYAKVDGLLSFDAWCDSLANGRSYVSDGQTHLMDFAARATSQPATSIEVGSSGSELRLVRPGTVELSVTVAARYDDSRKMSVELVVNGYPVSSQQIVADGSSVKLTFPHEFHKSSWVAVRIFPHAHANPIFVMVEEKPIRANRQSAAWCLRCVDECWKSKRATYRPEEQVDAEIAYEFARQEYRRILQESE